MSYLQKLTLFSLLSLPTIIYCMEEDTSSLKLEESSALCTVVRDNDPLYDKIGREIAANFKAYLLDKYADIYGPLGKVVTCDDTSLVKAPQKMPYYDYRNEAIAKLLNDYQNSLEPANIVSTKYKALYNGMNQELVLSFLDFLRLVNSSKSYPLVLKLILKNDYEKAVNYVQTTLFKLGNMEEIVQALPSIKKATEEQEAFYQEGKNIGNLECNFLKSYGLCIQQHPKWFELSQLHVTKRHALNKTITELLQTSDPTTVYELWKSAYQGYYDALVRLNIDTCFANTLTYVDLTTQNVEELKAIKNLNEAMRNAKTSSLQYIHNALFCTDMKAVIKFLDSQKSS